MLQYDVRFIQWTNIMVKWSEGSTNSSAALWNHRVLPGIKAIQEQFSLGNIGLCGHIISQYYF